MRSFVFVSDFFIEDYARGGAELTMEALIQTCPFPVRKLHSKNFTPELVENHPEVEWVLVNYTQAPTEALQELGSNPNNKFWMIECDYKYCKFRSSHLHKIQEGVDCDCHLSKIPGKLTKGLMKRSQKTFFMSQGQLNEYYRLFPAMRTYDNLLVQGSTWSKEHLDSLEELESTNKKKNGKWAVLGGTTWIKNQKENEAFLKSRNLSYDVIGGLPYLEFVATLAKYEGLCFIPCGFDTCPRIVVEAKLLGLKLILGDLVQMKDDDWFVTDREFLMSSLRTKPQDFWNKVLTGI